MKSTKQLQVIRGCKYPLYLAAALMLAVSTWAQAQSLISSSDFFDPDFQVRRPGSASLLSLTVNTSLYTPSSQTDGSVTWTHSAGGLVQVGTSVPVVGTVDVQLAAYTQTLADSLIFGRVLEVQTTGTLGLLGATITSLTDQALGASAINSWDSTAVVSNLNLSQGVLYSVSFDVATGAGINLGALSSANFTLLNGGTPIQDINTTETLNVLDLLTLGGGTTNVDFQFYAPEGLTDLSFNFAADTIADVNLLGDVSGNQTVLELTNFSVTPVPEPGSLALSALGVMFILRRRRPCGV